MKKLNQAKSKGTILAVDDNPAVLEIVERGLTRRGYQVFAISDGDRALELLDTMTPDAILCDISMPHMDGHEVLRAVKANPKAADIPFIFLTAFGDHEIVREGIAMGACGYIGKPFKIKELANALEHHLGVSA